MGEEQPGSPASRDRVRFTTLWDDFGGRVFAYACRHVDHHTAQEVVSETFLVAWRRLPEVPDEALPWLLVVARNTMSNHRRTDRRRDALTEKMARIEQVAGSAPGADITVTDRAEVLAALAALTSTEREALLLTAWDGLSAAEAARVVGCSVPAMHVRLFRARRRMRTEAATESTTSTPLRVVPQPRSIR
ncbi:RNA polymerase sigma factor [Rhodococcus sp. ABRD24]|uniref:RNA polymerase sigma factor n=1 Tax=Rhodococcus sp. ABRD24 TaxID=2507582 RepID=UPI00103D65AE|nr:RNA polymerase sigma factor [Rhodococcus sp. ABRD24]QBJ96438.1 RNA polymerase sigma factor [Rhodococcus sp. ABRD24]